MTYDEARGLYQPQQDYTPQDFLTGLLILSKYDDIEPGVALSLSVSIHIIVCPFNEKIAENEVRKLFSLGFTLDFYFKPFWSYIPQASTFYKEK